MGRRANLPFNRMKTDPMDPVNQTVALNTENEEIKE